MNSFKNVSPIHSPDTGYGIGYERIQHDAFQLFAWYAAARRVRAALPRQGKMLDKIATAKGEGEASGPSYERLAFACSRFVAHDLSPLLLGIASMLRVKDDDGSWQLSNAGRNSGKSSVIARLCKHKTFSRRTARPIGIRETCNKILHARAVDIETSVVSYSIDALNIPTGYIILVGTRYKKDWVVRLDAEQFAIAALKTVF